MLRGHFVACVSLASGAQLPYRHEEHNVARKYVVGKEQVERHAEQYQRREHECACERPTTSYLGPHQRKQRSDLPSVTSRGRTVGEDGATVRPAEAEHDRARYIQERREEEQGRRLLARVVVLLGVRYQRHIPRQRTHVETWHEHVRHDGAITGIVARMLNDTHHDCALRTRNMVTCAMT